ncbi:HlyD family secretion protein [Cyclonatronum proteinivorum]|uniref:HlyD family secretion protein n=2 Tax=Cyclonatronum proteinivorum TaxID=1457365 RepID=A0A345UGX3_9BACT|nr:HlyD family secretion protein [Cyclonatronum proteinivorum]
MLVIAILVIAFGGIIANSMGLINRGPSETPVSTEQAEIRTITQLVSASGRMQPEVEVVIRPDVSGEVIELNVREGDFVREGDLLLRIKPDIFQAQIDELSAMLLTQQARLEQARATMLQAEVEYLRNKQLYERGMVSELDYLASSNNYKAQQANVRAAEFQIQSARAQLRRSEEELQQTVIRSPKDGTISRLSIERGERVLGNTQTAGTEMMRIARLDLMEVIVDVNENQIMNVSVGDTARIEVDAHPNHTFEGIVTEIANSADITGSAAEQVTNYKVKIRVTSPHNIDASGAELIPLEASERPGSGFIPTFKPGMSATVDVLSQTVYDAVSVPIQAVTVRDFNRFPNPSEENGESPDTPAELVADRTNSGSANSNGNSRRGSREDFRRVVFVYEEGKVRRVEVETGISDNNYIQIIHGLQDGDEVVTGSFRILSRELQHNEAVRRDN